MVDTMRARRSDTVDLTGGIRDIGHQIESGNATPLINNLEIGSIFEDEDKEEGDGVTDLVLSVLRILRQDLGELVDSIMIIKFIPPGGTKPRGH